LTGVSKPEFTSRSIDGDIIITRFPTPNAQQKAIEDIIKELIKDGIPLDRITLLSPKRFGNSILNNSQFASDLVNKGLQISTIQAYKGLENTIVILFDFDEISSDESQRLLYVGISRARQKLYIILKKSIESSYQELIQTNFLKLS
jgi:superfamily I DNA and RNA helicase